MRTVYYQASSFIQHTDNIVDLEEFRRRQALTQHDTLARQPEFYDTQQKEPETLPAEETVFSPVVLTMSRAQRRRARRERRAQTLDTCASLAIVFMTLVFVLYVVL